MRAQATVCDCYGDRTFLTSWMLQYFFSLSLLEFQAIMNEKKPSSKMQWFPGSLLAHEVPQSTPSRHTGEQMMQE